MKRCAAPVAVVVALLLATAPAAAQPAGHDSPASAHRPSMGSLNVPAEIVAADRALARLVREKGLASALAATAAPDAQIALPNTTPGQPPLRVAPWLKAKPALPAAPAWNTTHVWLSCDGSHAASHGPGYTTIWQRQPKGGYRWALLALGLAGLVQPPAAPANSEEWITGKVAECPPRSPPAPRPAPKGKLPPPEYASGQSPDGSLVWAMALPAAGTRHFSLKLLFDGAMREVFDAKF